MFVERRHFLVSLSFVFLVAYSVVHGAELALAEGARHELVGDGVHVLVLLHEHAVNAEVGETEVVEGLEGGLHVLVLNLLDRLEVKLLGGLGIDADRAIHQSAGLLGGLVGSRGRLGDWLRLDHLLVGSDGNVFDNDILGHHLDGGGGLDQVALEILVDDGLLRLDTKDVARDLVTELYPACLHSEERGVATFLLWGLHLNRNLEDGTSDNLLLESDDLGKQVVT